VIFRSDPDARALARRSLFFLALAMNETLIERAITLANAAHLGQMRKYSGLPYIVHPMKVAARVMRLPGESLLQAALPRMPGHA
jgi:(p)ppGpp synthase/HD superfamily hydrolase